MGVASCVLPAQASSEIEGYALLHESRPASSSVSWTCRLALYIVWSQELRPIDSWLQVANDTIIILLGLVFCVMQPLIAPLAGKPAIDSSYSSAAAGQAVAAAIVHETRTSPNLNEEALLMEGQGRVCSFGNDMVCLLQAYIF